MTMIHRIRLMMTCLACAMASIITAPAKIAHHRNNKADAADVTTADSAKVVSNAKKGKVETGLACYYHRKAHGKRGTSGEKIDNNAMICAHKKHPMGTMLKVTNPANGKTVTVRVIDRGPHGRGRIIDLSYAAAKEIDIIRQGVAKVTVEVVE